MATGPRARVRTEGDDGGDKQDHADDLDEVVEQAVLSGQQHPDTHGQQKQGGGGGRQVQTQQVVQQSGGGEADRRVDDEQRGNGNQQVDVQHPLAEAQVAVDQTLAGGVGIARGGLKGRVFEQIGDDDCPQQGVAVAGPGARGLDEVGDADGGAGEQQARSQSFQKTDKAGIGRSALSRDCPVGGGGVGRTH